MKSLLKTVAALVAFLFLFGLVVSIINPESIQSQSKENEAASEGQNKPLNEEKALPGVEVNREYYGDDWPFTVDSGRVECRQGGAAVLVVGDWVYQLNGVAAQKGYADVSPIWRDNPEIPGTKIDIGKVRQLASSQC